MKLEKLVKSYYNTVYNKGQHYFVIACQSICEIIFCKIKFMVILFNGEMFLSTYVWNFYTSLSPSISPSRISVLLIIKNWSQSVIQYKLVQFSQRHDSINGIIVCFSSQIFKIQIQFCQRGQIRLSPLYIDISLKRKC